jgi:hypothetical protein
MYKVIRDPETGVRVDADICPEISWGVLNRLVQAIRGYPDGKTQWWLCRHNLARSRDDVEGPFSSREEAVTKRGARREFGVFGPFRAQDPTPLGDEAVPLAIRAKPRILSLDASPVEKVVVTLRDGGKNVTFFGDDWDALFWKLPAVEKFVIPYYVTTGGIAKGNEVYDAYVQPDVYALVHAPDTDYIVKKTSDPESGPELLPID